MNEGVFPGGIAGGVIGVRDPILAAAEEAAASGGPVSIALAAPTARFSFRAGAAAAEAVEGAFGLALPRRIGRRSAEGARTALMLGPDEWMLRAAPDEAEAIEAAFAALGPEAPHSLVDISAREIAVTLTGARAAELLSIGCPRDLGALPTGEGRRTIFDSVGVVLEREAEDAFRIEVWRSFAPHVLTFLAVGNREFAIGL